ncbi:hypothetical protein BU17DRAFT_80023 [Hysterangium stoloniferum]|nr:hypothetical protein BU17DRAFT_80023 [Hysterangium stoloniferum]
MSLAQRCAQRLSKRSIRFFSTSPVTRDSSLPSTRIRALISLYHGSSTFITPANLSQRIDLAFTDSVNVHSDISTYQWSYNALTASMNDSRRGGSSKSHYFGVNLDYSDRTWSDQQGARQAQISSALWGTHIDGRPGLEAVLETDAINEKEAKLLDQTASSPQSPTGNKS